MDGTRDVRNHENTAAYGAHGYAMNEIAVHRAVHYATVSPAVTRAEKQNV